MLVFVPMAMVVFHYNHGAVVYFHGSRGTPIGGGVPDCACLENLAADRSESASRMAIISVERANVGVLRPRQGIGHTEASVALEHKSLVICVGYYFPAEFIKLRMFPRYKKKPVRDGALALHVMLH